MGFHISLAPLRMKSTKSCVCLQWPHHICVVVVVVCCCCPFITFEIGLPKTRSIDSCGTLNLKTPTPHTCTHTTPSLVVQSNYKAISVSNCHSTAKASLLNNTGTFIDTLPLRHWLIWSNYCAFPWLLHLEIKSKGCSMDTTHN